tara:strand:- start:1725 stop:4355 length:2631 start_codon:yes stop_codon:yes gene_type:complete
MLPNVSRLSLRHEAPTGGAVELLSERKRLYDWVERFVTGRNEPAYLDDLVNEVHALHTKIARGTQEAKEEALVLMGELIEHWAARRLAADNVRRWWDIGWWRARLHGARIRDAGTRPYDFYPLLVAAMRGENQMGTRRAAASLVRKMVVMDKILAWLLVAEPGGMEVLVQMLQTAQLRQDATETLAYLVDPEYVYAHASNIEERRAYFGPDSYTLAPDEPQHKVCNAILSHGGVKGVVTMADNYMDKRDELYLALYVLSKIARHHAAGGGLRTLVDEDVISLCTQALSTYSTPALNGNDAKQPILVAAEILFFIAMRSTGGIVTSADDDIANRVLAANTIDVLVKVFTEWHTVHLRRDAPPNLIKALYKLRKIHELKMAMVEKKVATSLVKDLILRDETHHNTQIRSILRFLHRMAEYPPCTREIVDAGDVLHWLYVAISFIMANGGFDRQGGNHNDYLHLLQALLQNKSIRNTVVRSLTEPDLQEYLTALGPQVIEDPQGNAMRNNPFFFEGFRSLLEHGKVYNLVTRMFTEANPVIGPLRRSQRAPELRRTVQTTGIHRRWYERWDWIAVGEELNWRGTLEEAATNNPMPSVQAALVLLRIISDDLADDAERVAEYGYRADDITMEQLDALRKRVREVNSEQYLNTGVPELGLALITKLREMERTHAEQDERRRQHTFTVAQLELMQIREHWRDNVLPKMRELYKDNDQWGAHVAREVNRLVDLMYKPTPGNVLHEYDKRHPMGMTSMDTTAPAGAGPRLDQAFVRRSVDTGADADDDDDDKRPAPKPKPGDDDYCPVCDAGVEGQEGHDGPGCCQDPLRRKWYPGIELEDEDASESQGTEGRVSPALTEKAQEEEGEEESQTSGGCGCGGAGK